MSPCTGQRSLFWHSLQIARSKRACSFALAAEVKTSATPLGHFSTRPTPSRLKSSKKAFGRIEYRRDVYGTAQTETRHFALSLMPAREVVIATVRAHWKIENALHWQLDVSFREDAARNRKDKGPANIAILRRRALDLARRNTSKGPLSTKLKRVGWSDAFLLSLRKQLAGA